MAAHSMTGDSFAGTATAELSDLMRSLARTFGRAQKRLAQCQEQLLASLGASGAGAVPALHVRLPSGQLEELSALELCRPQRKYLDGMVVDLTCTVQEMETSDGARLALRLLPRSARPRGAYPVRLSFDHDSPIHAKLCFAGQVVRSVQLHDADLPSQELSEQAQCAQIYLLDPADAAQIRPHATEIYPAVPLKDFAAPAIAYTAPAIEASTDAPADASVLMPLAVAGAVPPAAAASEFAHSSPAGTAAPGVLPQPTFPEAKESSESTDTRAMLQQAFAPTARSPAARARQGVLRYAIPLLLGLGGVGLTARLAPQLARRQTPPAQPTSVMTAPLSSAPPPYAPAIRQPVAAPVSPPAAAAATAAAAADAAAAKPDKALLPVRFYALDREGVTSLSCNGREVVLRAVEQRGRAEARVLLEPGARCTANGLATARVYTYEYLSQGRTDAAGERIVQVRFHKH